MGFIRNEHGMYHRGAEKAFDQAIDSGHLGDTEEGVTPYAGDYMYMYSLGDMDYFKHIDTRKYWHVPITK
tara:strand:+ start:448 stop:657 length:210 start_codon:yes stop_codon:yes gene_type:complete